MFSRSLFFLFFSFWQKSQVEREFVFIFPHELVDETKIRLEELKLVVKRNHASAAKRARRRRRREKREPPTTPSGGFEKRTVEKRERGTATFNRRKEKCTTKFIRSEDDQKR